MIRRFDFVLLIILFLLGVVITVFIFYPTKETGKSVEIRINGKITKTLPLSKNTTYEIKPGPNETNVLSIKDGIASIIKANCKDHICVNKNGISKIGESIICLPHKLSIEITGDSNDAPDAIVK